MPNTFPTSVFPHPQYAAYIWRELRKLSEDIDKASKQGKLVKFFTTTDAFLFRRIRRNLIVLSMTWLVLFIRPTPFCSNICSRRRVYAWIRHWPKSSLQRISIRSYLSFTVHLRFLLPSLAQWWLTVSFCDSSGRDAFEYKAQLRCIHYSFRGKYDRWVSC